VGKHSRIVEVLTRDYPLTIEEISQQTSLTIDQVKYVIDNPVTHGHLQGVIRESDGVLAYQLSDHPYTINPETSTQN
jgi:hypothetical protein